MFLIHDLLMLGYMILILESIKSCSAIYMEENSSENVGINIDEAINATSGTRKYQKIMVGILLLGAFSISPIVMCSDFYLPEFATPDEKIKSGKSKTATDDLGPNEGSIATKVLFRYFYFGGLIIGFLVLPWLADKYGRKKVIQNYFVISAMALTAAAFSFTALSLCIAGFFIGVHYIVADSLSLILCLETLDLKNRNLYLGLYQTAWPFASALFTVLYWFDVYWRYAILVSAIILLIEIYLLAYIEESPRFLLTNAVDVQACYKALDRISLINGEGNFTYNLVSDNTRKYMSLSIGDIFYSKRNVFKIIICGSMWFSIVFGYYSTLFLQINIKINLFTESDSDSTTEKYAQSVGNDILNVISVIIYMMFINLFGRKKVAFYSLCFDGAAFISIALLLSNGDANAMFLVFTLARFAIGGQFALLYVYTAEQFPTYIRCTCLGICGALGRIAGLVASSLPSNDTENDSTVGTTLIIIGALALVTSPFVLLLEETHHKELAEMIENDKREPLLE